MKPLKWAYVLSALLLVAAVFSSCDKKVDTQNTPANLEGTWRLVEIYMDPGDGSGDFEPVNSYKTLTFSSGGALSSNGDICQISAAVGKPSTGTYSTADSTLSGCSNGGKTWNIDFELKGSDLLLHYPCIEACIAKFQKIQ